jgi:hypothetical protein
MPNRDDQATLAERLVKAAGSKAEAHRLIDAANIGGVSGRSAEYLEADAQVLFEVEMRENWYRHASDEAKKFYRVTKTPKRRALIKEIVSREFANGNPLGPNENAAIQRIIFNSSLIEKLSKENRRSGNGRDQHGGFWTELAKHLPPDALEQVRKMDPSRPGKFGMGLELIVLSLAVARQYPGLIKRAMKEAAALTPKK